MDPETLATLTQFGTAGLVGWLWLSERRAASTRERLLEESQQRLRDEREVFRAILAEVVGAIKENTRVLGALERQNEHLARLIELALRERDTPKAHAPSQAA